MTKFSLLRNGNMLVRPVEGKTYSQHFNIENRLDRVTDSVTGIETAFYYDADTVLTKKIITNGSIVTTTIYAGGLYEVERVGTGTPKVTRYTMLGGKRVAMRVSGSSVPAENGTTYLHGDHLGSASLATSDTGAVISALRYTPYGAPRDGSLPTDRRYTGQREEAGIGLYDYNARFYDPALGRFISPDTIIPEPGNAQAFNRYSYTLNNPMKYTDPSGHMQQPAYHDYDDNSVYASPLLLYYGPTWMAEGGLNYSYDDLGPWFRAHPGYDYKNDPVMANPDAYGIQYSGSVQDVAGAAEWHAVSQDVTGLNGLELGMYIINNYSGEAFQTGLAGIAGLVGAWDERAAGIGAWSTALQKVEASASPGEIAQDSTPKPIQNSVTKSRVLRYVNAMASGKWNWDSMGDKIQILSADNGDFITQGHHRILAVEALGIDIPETAIQRTVLEGVEWPHSYSWQEVSWDGW